MCKHTDHSHPCSCGNAPARKTRAHHARVKTIHACSVLALAVGMAVAPTLALKQLPAPGGGVASANLLEMGAAQAAEPAANKAFTKYTCPMHPHYIANEFGACPICGMDLVPMKSAEEAASETSADERQSILVSAETIQNMGVRTSKVENVRFGRQIRAYGIVKENERLQYVINNRQDGWIEQLNIEAVGDPVRKGQLLFKLYSPEIYVSQRDYLTTLRTGAKERRRAARLRLQTYGVQARAIRQLEKTRQAMMQVPFYAESNGVVSKLSVSQGAFVKRGATIAKIQNYTKVWLVVSVAEQDMGFLSRKSVAKVSFPTLMDRKLKAKIDYIYPTIDSASRTGQVRLVIDNKSGDLRPGTYADVVFEVKAQDKLAVPTEALLNGESGKHVILAKGEGRFQPMPVKTGLSSGGWTEVVDGLKAKDEIVVSGQFLLDSESALQESFRKLQRLKTPLPLLDLDKNQMAMVDHLIDAALYIHEARIDGYDIDPKFIEPAKQIRGMLWPRFKHTQLAFVLLKAEAAIGKAQKARSESQLKAALDELVKVLKPWIMEGKPDYYQGKKLNLFKEVGKGRLWVQLGDKPFNPFGNAKAELLPWPGQKDEPNVEQAKPAEKKVGMKGETQHVR